MEFFDNSLEELQSYLPLWWRKDDPSAELYKWLLTIAGQIDATSQAFETAYNNSILTRADRASLVANWAWLWGLENEQLPPTVDGLIAYIQARAQEDGSLQSLIRTLTALIATPVNTTGVQLLFGAHTAAAVLDSGPVAYWRLGDTVGAAAAAAAAGGVPATVTGGVTFGAAGALASDPDTAASFDGSSGWLNVPDAAPLRLVNELTLEAWVKPTDLSQNRSIMGKSNFNRTDCAYEFLIDTAGKIEYVVLASGGVVGIAGTGVIPTGAWTHVATSFSHSNGDRWRSYINGSLDREVSGFITPAVTANLLPLQIGARAGGSDPFKGPLDEVAIYNAELTPAQLKTHYEAGIGGAFAFPSDGSGIKPLFQSTPYFPNLVFPADGSPFRFPDQALYFDPSGAGLTFDPGGAGLALPANPEIILGSGVTGFFDITERLPTAYQFTVTTKSYLAFDRAAVARAIERFRLAHLLPAIYQEANY